MRKNSEDNPSEEEERFQRSIKYVLLGYLVLLAVSLIGYRYDFWIYSTRSHLLRALFVGPIILGVFYGLHRLFTGGITRRKKFLVAVSLMVAFPLWLVFQTLFHFAYGLGSDPSAGISIVLAYPVALVIAELRGRTRDYRLGAIQ
ncbi:hypothetical protein AKJ66_04215 [candidate division MSBL1 archaeon SCGC-AAA259E22]|uniref:Uncharacterized protein n=1 Tax=candidate division MSBL1 archaeon SCGC-AAA259E22 TaxID=1698265 RepID=A0A133UDZ5_9EURY|nr:hypothetical protein AKJ66_04215 [candidate division MSBL1 archaeon SCGC-AAA259E22]